jgi:cobalt/nickel transport protein
MVCSGLSKDTVMNHRSLISVGMLLSVIIAGSAHAHFQVLYTPETALEKGGETSLAMVFTHPFHAGPSMDMSEPYAFYVISQRGEGAIQNRTDLSEYLRPLKWGGLAGEAAAYTAELPRRVTRSLGDYVFVLEAAPYYEAEEDKYIQQLTKTIMNVGGIPGNWADPVGLATEIIPLDKPYANWVGGVFRGVVMSGGEPVPNAEIEVEYMNHPPDLEANGFSRSGMIVEPQASFGTMGIRANDRGEFMIGLPRAGWWGICALATGPDTEHEGKELSQDAVLWIQATEMTSSIKAE